MGDLKKTAQKALHDPLGAAGDLLSGALGIGGPSTAEKRNRSYVDVHAKIRAGNWPALADAVNNSRWLGARWEALWATKNRSRDANAAEDARRRAGVPRDMHPSENLQLTGELVGALAGENVWGDSTGTVPTAEPSSPAENPTVPSAPPAPKPTPSGPKPKGEPKPCKYGLRGPDGKCPKKSELTGSTASPLAGASSSRPCKYGPRGADGYCPKKPPSGRLTKRQSATVRKAAAAAEKIVTAGVKGAGLAIAAGLRAAGVGAGAAAATVASVAGAALLGWFLGRGITEFYETNSVEQVKANAAVRANHARRALAEALGVYDPDKPGVGLTLAQQADIRKAYNDSIAAIERSGRDTAYAARVRASLGNPNAQVF